MQFSVLFIHAKECIKPVKVEKNPGQVSFLKCNFSAGFFHPSLRAIPEYKAEKEKSKFKKERIVLWLLTIIIDRGLV